MLRNNADAHILSLGYLCFWFEFYNGLPRLIGLETYCWIRSCGFVIHSQVFLTLSIPNKDAEFRQAWQSAPLISVVS